MCANDIRDQLEKDGHSSELCSQLGAVLGMLGDCWSVITPWFFGRFAFFYLVWLIIYLDIFMVMFA